MQTKHGLVATWIDDTLKLYGALFDPEGTRIVSGPTELADYGSEYAIAVDYQVMDADTLVGIKSTDGFHIKLSTLHVSDDGLKFSHQYNVAFSGPQVEAPVDLEVMDGGLYMTYANSTYSGNTVNLAKLDPLPE